LRTTTSYDVLNVKIDPTGLSVGSLMNLKSEINIRRFWVIARMWGQKPLCGLTPKFLAVYVPDLIMCFKFSDDRFRV